MSIPTRAECLGLLRAHRVPPHIVAHSLRVAQAGELLAGRLAAAGRRIDPTLVAAGCLLHDLTKMRSLETGEDHARTAAAVLEARGWAEAADVVGQHVRLRPEVLAAPPNEAQVVFYADKRVMHHRVVDLDERFADLVARYGVTPEKRERLRRLHAETRGLEARLFAGLDIGPGDLDRLNLDPLEDFEPWRERSPSSATPPSA
ncbi:HD domain-containing protein [Dissulfurirhabdus thermomarina]|uniref:HD domain-containing protein n=1 Tax=Dissulfurirhabdus thermomarina TaxID=1765737 RepID=A0A6N9TPT3_DISTH|nr:HD domain-containing protein [Dissulfurirhabdus thermomarina]NDY43179.1 HD domain-containing protein [Dissulfurirhabdus thermomarina]NMX22847.1 HD domain-containing protein [Dissulfurirhabdus thermomarina]